MLPRMGVERDFLQGGDDFRPPGNPDNSDTDHVSTEGLG